MYPVLNKNFALLKQYEKSVIYPLTFGDNNQISSGSYEYEKINSTAAEILELSNGNHSIKEIAEILAKKHNEDINIASDIVNTFIRECSAKKIITLINEPTVNNINVSGNYETIYPFMVQFELTKICPLKCLHCFNNAGIAKTNELSTDEVLVVLQKIKQMGVKRMQLTGGEPLARRDFSQIIKYASKSMMAIVVTSSGYIMTDALADEISNCKNVVVQISVDGTEKTHNRIRGLEDSYEKAINTVELLLSKSVPVSISCTINNTNVDDIEYVTAKARDLGAFQITYGITLPKGRAKNNDITEINKEQIEELLLKLRKKYISEKFFINVGEGVYNGKVLTCGRGESMICIRENGDVSPCLQYNYVYGNLLRQVPDEIFHHTRVNKFLNFTPPNVLKCNSCEEFHNCGCCVALAYDVPEYMCKWKQSNKDYFQTLHELEYKLELPLKN